MIFSTPTVMVSATSDGSPPFYAIITLAIVPGQRTSAPAPRSIVSLLSAAVMIGKGGARPAQTQIGRLVTIGNGDPDQTKTTILLCRTGKKSGKDW